MPLFKRVRESAGGGSPEVFKWVQIKRKSNGATVVGSGTHPLHTVLDAALDVVGSAEAGDEIEVEVRFSAALAAGFGCEVATMVGGNPVTGLSSGIAYNAANHLNMEYNNTDSQTRPNYRMRGFCTLTEADIDAGTVTLRLLVGTTGANSTVDATNTGLNGQTSPIVIVAKNYGKEAA